MSHFRLHTRTNGKDRLKYVIAGIACILAVGAAGYALHSIGTARAKSRETVELHTGEELEQYLLDSESEDYNLNGRYQLEADLSLGWLEQSIGTNVEPFTGTFDGNGHIISGLTRPLFGVVEGGAIQNLFFSEAEIVHPFTYFDGDEYVDGYGALAAYAVDTVIRNCGMSGEIKTASPAEAEYQVGKASPAEAEEVKGPGALESTGGPGVLEESRTESGSSAETEPPEIEPSESEPSESEPFESEPSESEPSESESSENEPSESQPAGNEEETKHTGDGTEIESTADIRPGDDVADELGTGTEAEPTSDLIEAGEETGAGETSGAEIVISGSDESGANITKTETVAFYPVRRQLLTKTSSVVDAGAEGALIASPSEAEDSSVASPPDAEQTDPMTDQEGENDNDAGEETEAELEYIGNPAGDIYILVTAERVAAGGLVAQTAGETLIADSFVLVMIGSDLKEVDTYAGGLAGILGGNTRAENSYASGLVNSNDVTGGFAAVNSGTIQNCYSTMTIGETGNVRGAFTASGNGILSGCVYDLQLACVKEENILTDNSIADDSMAEAETVESAELTESASDVAEVENHAGMKQIGPGEWVETEPLDEETQPSNQETQPMPEQDLRTQTDAEMEAGREFRLKGLSTAQMTGTETQIPGIWYLAENAYPQIEYFALQEQELIVENSKASVIALVLPDGLTLMDVLEEGDIVLPLEVDGQEIQWDTEGDIRINENNQVVTDGKVSVSIHEAPEVGASLTEQEVETTTSSQTETDKEPISKSNPVSQPGEGSPGTGLRLKASVGGVTRSFSLTALKEGSGYASWADVGAEFSKSTGTMSGMTVPEKNADGYYEIYSAGQLAWFAYQVNQNTETSMQSANVKLMADIDLDGADSYGGSRDNPLPWIPIGTADGSIYYKGTFDGNGHIIDYMKVEGQDGYTGFMAAVGGGAKIRRLGIGPNSSVTAKTGGNAFTDGTAALAGGVIAEAGKDQIVIEGCYNRAAVIGKSDHTGAFVGHGEVEDPGDQRITNCYNAGSISVADGASGTASAIAGTFSNDTAAGGIRNCCWISGGSATFSGRAVSSVSRSAMTVEQAKPVTAEDMKAGETVALLNESVSEPLWQYQPWNNDNDGYPLLSGRSADAPTNWSEVGAAMAAAGKTLTGTGTAAAPFQIGTAEDLALFAHKTNANETNADGTGFCVELTADINLFGIGYVSYEPSMANIDYAFEWGGMFTDSRYTGTFDGKGHHVSFLRITESGTYIGFMRYLGNGAVIKDFGIESGKIQLSRGIRISALIGNAKGNNIQILRCWNKADIPIGNYEVMGGILGAFEGGSNLLIDGCYNEGDVGSLNGSNIGGIAGKIFSGSAIIRNCYNAGTITGRTCLGGVVGTFMNGSQLVTQCYNIGQVDGDRTLSETKPILGHMAGPARNNYYYLPDAVPQSGCKSLTEVQLKSWAAAFALNGSQLSQSTGISWTFDPAGIEYPKIGTLPPADDWSVVGQGCLDELIGSPVTGDGDGGVRYCIESAEHLAAMQVEVSKGKQNSDAILLSDLDLTGMPYGGTDAKPLQWRPIGNSTNPYTGDFNGNGKVISHMRVVEDGYAGLFGCAGGGAKIRRLGLDGNCTVTAVSPGNSSEEGTAAFVGAVVSAAGEDTQIVIEDSYNRAKVTGKGSGTGAFVGTDIGTIPGKQRITACYNAGNITTASGAAKVIAGSFENGTDSSVGGIYNCYWDQETSGAGSVAGGSRVRLKDNQSYSTSDMKSFAMASRMNQASGVPLWQYAADKNLGYPSFGTMTVESWEDVGIKATAPLPKNTSSMGTAGTSSNPYQIETPSELAWFAWEAGSAKEKTGLCAELLADIELFGEVYTGNSYDPGDADILLKALVWKPIGREHEDYRYSGTFRGNNHTISYMYADRDGAAGLFGSLGTGAVIENVKLSDSLIKADGNGRYTGGIAGSILGADVTIRECENKGKLSSSGAYVGGMAGYIAGTDAKIAGCWNSGTIESTAGNDVGGIAGAIAADTIIDGCYNLAGSAVDGTTGSNTGGILGRAITGTLTLRNSYNQGTVSGGANVGGIAGILSLPTQAVTGCYNAGAVTGASNVGAVVGISTSSDSVTYCFYDKEKSQPTVDTYAKGMETDKFATWGRPLG